MTVCILHYIIITILAEGLKGAIDQLQHVVPKLSSMITDYVSHQCNSCLEGAQTIPRLYRRTNREASYVHGGKVTSLDLWACV